MTDESGTLTSGTLLDGNVAAGPLADVFAADLTSAVGQCAGCAQVSALGTARAHTPEIGLVVRCSGCDSVLLRMVQDRTRTWLDLQGLRYLQFRNG